METLRQGDVSAGRVEMVPQLFESLHARSTFPLAQADHGAQDQFSAQQYGSAEQSASAQSIPASQSLSRPSEQFSALPG
jgi:hypothetical protein